MAKTKPVDVGALVSYFNAKQACYGLRHLPLAVRKKLAKELLDVEAS